MEGVRSTSEQLAVIRMQGDACRGAGSQLYARLLDVIVGDVEAGGPCDGLIAADDAEPLTSALPLRFLGALHRLVLRGAAPELARHYPSTGGDPSADPEGLRRDLLMTVEEHAGELRTHLASGVQTNEVGRSAVLAGGYALVARRWGLPLRVLEVGASAGLNLRWDRYWYDTGHSTLGDPASPVRFTDVWEGRPADLGGEVEVVERRGCDREPVDPTSAEGRSTLLSYVWPDQVERVERLRAALDVAASVPAPVDRADAPEWLEERLADRAPSVATVVAHSIVLQYLSPAGRRRLQEVIVAAGGGATERAPLAWLRMEPGGHLASISLTVWPGGDELDLGEAGYHGRPIRWAGP